jgi:hypothetical protein
MYRKDAFGLTMGELPLCSRSRGLTNPSRDESHALSVRCLTLLLLEAFLLVGKVIPELFKKVSTLGSQLSLR